MEEVLNQRFRFANDNVQVTITKVFFVEYLIKGGKCGCTNIDADSFADAVSKFNSSHDTDKHVLSSIKFVGVMINGRFYKATETFD